MELPSYFPEQMIESYPDAKFVLVERSPESWARSMMNSVVPMTQDVIKFPTSFLKHFDPFMKILCDNTYMIGDHFSDGRFNQPGGLEACAEWYRN